MLRAALELTDDSPSHARESRWEMVTICFRVVLPPGALLSCVHIAESPCTPCWQLEGALVGFSRYSLQCVTYTTVQGQSK